MSFLIGHNYNKTIQVACGKFRENSLVKKKFFYSVKHTLLQNMSTDLNFSFYKL